jgi:DNA-binding Lrp family transcriptional regulator
MTSSSIQFEGLKVLWALQENPSATVQQLSRATGFRHGKVQYILRRLKDDRKLVIRPFVNFLATGAHYVAVFATLHATSRNGRKALAKFLNQEPSVGWCSELVGDYELGFTVSCRHLAEIPNLFERMRSRTGVEISEYVLSPRLNFSLFKRKFLVRLPVKASSFDALYPQEPAHLDTIDHRILQVLADERFDSIREVARLIGEPVSTVDRRIRELKASNVILGEFVDLAPAHLGVHPYRLLIRTKCMSKNTLSQMFQFARAHPRIIFFMETLGVFNIEIGLELAEPGMIMEVISDLNEHFGAQIHTLRTLMETTLIKWSNYPGLTGSQTLSSSRAT